MDNTIKHQQNNNNNNNNNNNDDECACIAYRVFTYLK